MRKLLSVLLAIVMTAALAVPALAAGYADAAPPAWVDAKEYVVFNGNHACTDEEWANVLKLRADAAAGHKEPVKGSELYDVWMSADESSAATTAYKFELGLIGIKYAANSTNHRESQQASKYLGSAYVKYRSNGKKASMISTLLTSGYTAASCFTASPRSPSNSTRWISISSCRVPAIP